MPSFLSSNRKKIPECAIIRAQRSCRLRGRHRRRRHRRYPRLRCRSVVTVVPRYDNFTFIDRSGRTSLYLSFHPPFLSLVSLFRFASLSPVFLTLGQSFFFLARSLSRAECSLSVYSARRVREIPGCAPSKLKRSCTLGIRGLACTYIIRRKLRRAM